MYIFKFNRNTREFDIGLTLFGACIQLRSRCDVIIPKCTGRRQQIWWAAESSSTGNGLFLRLFV